MGERSSTPTRVSSGVVSPAALAFLLCLGSGTVPSTLDAVANADEVLEEEIPRLKFTLDEAKGNPGETVVLHLSLLSEAPVISASFAINFDESRLRIEAASEVPVPPGDFSPVADAVAANFDNRNASAGDQTYEGWIRLEVQASEAEKAIALPAGGPVPIFELRFRILADAPPGFTPVKFADIGPVRLANQTVILTNTAEVDNTLGAREVRTLEPEELEDGGVEIGIVGETGFFIRGDSNMDERVDIADPIRTLIYLFQGSSALPCDDAADANDDGTVDVSDPVFCLERLFVTGAPFPPPTEEGPDPTEDDLRCEATD